MLRCRPVLICVSFLAVASLLFSARSATGDIYQWEWVDPGDPSQGVKQSTVVCPGGAGVSAVPNAYLASLDLTQAYMFQANLSGACLAYANLISADLSNANLCNASLFSAMLKMADLGDAVVKGADFSYTTSNDFTAGQLYSTASYKSGDLAGIILLANNLTGWNLARQNLTGANFTYTNLAGADLTDAVITGASFRGAYNLAPAQFYSTADYKSKSLPGINLSMINLAGWNFAGQNLAGATFSGGTLNNADLHQANLTGAKFNYTTDWLHNTIMKGANLSQANLTNASFWFADLTGANLTKANLTNSNLQYATVANALFTDAEIGGASFYQSLGFRQSQLYSTANYKAKSLKINLGSLDLTGWTFANQNLTGSKFRDAPLGGADFTDAVVSGADFARTDSSQPIPTAECLISDQLYSTASYKAKNLRGINLSNLNMAGWNFSNQDLTGATIYCRATGSSLMGTDFTDAVIQGARIGADYWYAYFTSAQLYSTASYKAKNLTGINLMGDQLSGWNFANQNLSNAIFNGAYLDEADFTDAKVCGADFGFHAQVPPPPHPETRITIAAEQLYSTASYKAKDLREINFGDNDLAGWNFANQYLANAKFDRATLISADLTGADTRGAQFLDFSGAITTNMIRPDGSIPGLDLSGGRSLPVRNYHGDPSRSLGAIPITVQNSMAMGADGTLQMILDENPWDSTISFASGIPVALGGMLELDFADDADVSGQIGHTFKLFDWSGVTSTGTFDVSSLYTWNTTNLYASGEVTLEAVPEPATLSLLALGGLMALRRRRK